MSTNTFVRRENSYRRALDRCSSFLYIPSQRVYNSGANSTGIATRMRSLLSAPDVRKLDQGLSRGKEDFPMREYELVFIVHPDLDDTAFKEVVEKVQGWITGGGGSIAKIDLWGKRKLAYEIRKQKEGQYVLMHTQMDPAFSAQLERNLRYLEPVMRFLVTSIE